MGGREQGRCHRHQLQIEVGRPRIQCGPNSINPSKEIKASAWKVTTLSVVKVFEELRNARQPGVSAEISPNQLHVVGRFLYATLQELKVMREFQLKGFEGHPSIQIIKMTHVFDNYTLPI